MGKINLGLLNIIISRYFVTEALYDRLSPSWGIDNISYRYALKKTRVIPQHMDIEFNHPTSGKEGVSFPVTLNIRNFSDASKEFILKTGNNDFFFLSGDISSNFSLGSQELRTFNYTLYPKHPGKVPLPQLIVSTEDSKEILQDQFVFISPINQIAI